VKWLAAECARDLGGDAYLRLDAEAAAVPAGSDGLVALPYFLGEKTPLFDPDARGALVGLTLSHGRGHLHRALLEAVAYGFRHHVDVLEAGGHRIAEVRVMDGGARSPLWRRIVADVLGRPIGYAEDADVGSAHGVARVAGVAAGLWGWEDDERGEVAIDEPEPENVARYREGYARYRDLYARLSPAFRSAARARDGA
jgi:xylulokinase